MTLRQIIKMFRNTVTNLWNNLSLLQPIDCAILAHSWHVGAVYGTYAIWPFSPGVSQVSLLLYAFDEHPLFEYIYICTIYTYIDLYNIVVTCTCTNLLRHCSLIQITRSNLYFIDRGRKKREDSRSVATSVIQAGHASKNDCLEIKLISDEKGK